MTSAALAFVEVFKGFPLFIGDAVNLFVIIAKVHVKTEIYSSVK